MTASFKILSTLSSYLSALCSVDTDEAVKTGTLLDACLADFIKNSSIQKGVFAV
jgi:hypothetical protein